MGVLSKSNIRSDSWHKLLFFFQEALLKAKRESLEASNKQFEEELVEKYKSVDETFTEKEKQLREYYQLLSEKLHQSVNIWTIRVIGTKKHCVTKFWNTANVLKTGFEKY